MSGGDSLSVLVAEDDPVFRRVLEFTLKREGWSVYAAPDGQTAWDALNSQDFDFLITDQQMPRMTGLELLERKQANPQLKLIPTILCTAKCFELDGSQLMESFSLVDILHKPFSPQTVVTRIDEAVAAHHAPGPRVDVED